MDYINPYLVTNRKEFENALEYLKNLSIFSVDTETTGLDPFLNKIIMIQIGDLHKQFIIDAKLFSKESIQYFLKDLLNNNSLKVGHNLKFDYQMFLTNYNIRINNFFDTMIAERVLNCGKAETRYGLKNVVLKYLEEERDKTVRDEFPNLGNKAFSYKQIKYGCLDVIDPLRVREIQIGLLEQDNLIKCNDLERAFIPAIAEIELNGFPLNVQKWLSLSKNIEKEALIKKETLDNYLIINNHSKFFEKQLDLFSDKIGISINWDSPKQVIEYLNFLNFSNS